MKVGPGDGHCYYLLPVNLIYRERGIGSLPYFLRIRKYRVLCQQDPVRFSSFQQSRGS